MRHIDARQSWVEALRDDNIVKFKWVPTKDNLSDIGTKLLDIQTFKRLRGELMVRKAIPAVPTAAAPGNYVVGASHEAASEYRADTATAA